MYSFPAHNVYIYIHVYTHAWTGTCIHEHTECVVTVHCVCPGTRMSSVVTITASLSIELLRFREINEEWRGQVSNDIHSRKCIVLYLIRVFTHARLGVYNCVHRVTRSFVKCVLIYELLSF